MKHTLSKLATIPILVLIAPAAAVAQAGPRLTPTAAPAPLTAASAKYSPPCGIESPSIQLNAAAIAASGPMAAAAQPLKQQTRVDVPYLIGVIGQTIPLKAKLTLKPEGGPVPNHTVFFRVDGQFIAAARTDGQGNVQVPYKIPDVYATKVVEAKYPGSETCAGSRAENSLGMTKAPSKITFTSDQKSVRTGSMFILDGALIRTTDDKSIDAHAVTLALDGQPQTISHPRPDTFRWMYTPQHGAAGNHTVQAQFPGDGLDGASTATYGFTVLPELIPAELSWDSVYGSAGEIKTLTARLRRTDGLFPLDPLHNGIPGAMVWARREGVQVPTKTLGKVLTDASGTARISFKIDDPPGLYNLMASIDSLDAARRVFDIKQVAANHRLEVSRAPAKVMLFAPATLKVGGCFELTVQVTRAADGLPLAAIPVSVTGLGSQTTGPNGRTIYLPCARSGGTGPLRLDASSSATDLYLADTGSVTINVVP
jgi:hypothetical protein